MTHSVHTEDEDRAVFSRPLSDAERPDADGAAATERTNNTLRAYRELRRRILDGEMAAGTQYLEQELAELLRMSRTPVREALIRLAEERLVEVRPRHGVRILPITAEDIREIYELLTEIEVFAARRLAERGLNSDELAAMTNVLTDMERALEDGDLKRWALADRRFHERLITAAGNAKACEVARILCDQSEQARMQVAMGDMPHTEVTRGHAALIDAIRRRNIDEAQQLKREQLARAGQRMFEFMKKQESAG